MQDFVHLHVHTYYSILDGQSSISRLVDKAIGNGMKGMAITDHGDMFGIKEFFDYCNGVNGKRTKEGLEPFKPIFGCEMYVARHRKEDKVKENGDRSGYHLIVLAKNYKGYKNLIKLVSNSWIDGFYGRPRTDRADLERYHEGLIVCSACIGGEVPKKIINDDIEGAREAAQWYHNLFGDDYYLELQRHEVKDPSQRANRETFPLQQKANKVLLELAKEYGIKVICSNDAHFVDQENAEAHDHLLCLSTGKDLDDPTRMLYTKQEWFKTREEMNDVFQDIPEALSNTLEILDKVETYDIEHAPIMPFFPIPEDFGTEEQWREKFTPEQLFDEFTSDENGENQLPREEGEKKIKKLGGIDKLYRIKFEADYLAKLAYEGAERLYPTPLTDEVSERIKFELHIMKTMGFPGYFLIVQDFINSAQQELGVMVGPGRGSAAGSVVAYCLGITKIDPIKYDLLFERFLNPDRISLPDIDTDFDDDGRGRVLEWVEEKYGHENCAHIITYGTMATKNSIKDVARVEKLPLDKANYLCKLIPDKLPDGLKMNIGNAIKCIPELREAEASADPKLRNTMEYAKMLEGTVRGTGIHACGFIICRDPISDWVPVSVAEDKNDPGHKLHCTQYDGHVIESTGLIKMDFLGLKTLSIIKEAVENIRLSLGIEIDIDKISIDDPATYALYQEGKTIGTFQFESTGMQRYLRDLRPTTFEDLIAMNALYRPGPMQYIPQFIARKHGEEPIVYDLPCMEKYLKDTYGITVYQEQVMLLSREIANFTRGESDALRKAMGKKLIEKLNHMYPKFIEGGKANGHDPKILEKIWEDWRAFASYAFNKSHATCYSWVAYQTAYLKANYPSQYMAGVMSRSISDISTVAKLMDECKTMGIHTLGPDINESYKKFSVIHNGDIRFGMAAIKGVGEAAVEEIIRERDAHGTYESIYDLVERVNLSVCTRKNLEGLAIAGAFDCFPKISREQYVMPDEKGEIFLDALVRYGTNYQMDKSFCANSLFGPSEMVEIAKPQPSANVAHWSDLERLNRERELIGIYISGHPLDAYRIVLDHLCTTRMVELEDKEKLARRDITFGGIVTGVRTGFTGGGKPYGIVRMEDYSGVGEIALFGEEWLRQASYFTEGNTFFISARVEPRRFKEGEYDLRLGRIELLADVKEERIKSITFFLTLASVEESIVNDLIGVILENPGNTEVYFCVNGVDSEKRLLLRSGNCRMNINRNVLDFVKENEGIEYKIN